jgi:hypothetical protein
MKGVAWVLPLLDRPKNQRAVEGFHIDTAVGQPAPRAALPAGWQATGHGQPGFPTIEIERLSKQQQHGHHPGKEHQMTLVTDGAVLTQEADQPSMQLGMGCHEVLVCSDTPTLPWLPAHPMACDPFCCKGVSQLCRESPPPPSLARRGLSFTMDWFPGATAGA